MIVVGIGRGESASDLRREGTQTHARVVPCCALRLQRLCPGSTDTAHGLRHTPSALRESVSSVATRDVPADERFLGVLSRTLCTPPVHRFGKRAKGR